MNKKNCIRVEKPKDKQNTVVISFRIWPHMSKWMRDQNLSPRAILIEGCKELGYDPEENTGKNEKQIDREIAEHLETGYYEEDDKPRQRKRTR